MDLQEHLEALAVDAGAQHHRNDVSVDHMLSERSLNLLLGELFAQEIALHIFLTGLCDGLDKGVPGNGQVLLHILREWGTPRNR